MEKGALLTIGLGVAIWFLGPAPTIEASSPEPRPATNASQKTKRRVGGFDDYQLPAGSLLTVQMRSAIGSDSSRVGHQIRATLRDPVNRDGAELIPAGSVIHGKVVDVVRASAREPRGRIAIAFYVIEHARTGSRAAIQTQSLVFEAPGAEEPAARRSSKKQPLDVRLTSGDALTLTLAKPLTVRIPK